MQLSRSQSGGKLRQAWRGFFQYRQYLLNRKVFFCQVILPFLQRKSATQRLALPASGVGDVRWPFADHYRFFLCGQGQILAFS
jgi:hypothetical protein